MQYKLFAFFKTWLPKIPVSEVRQICAEETRKSAGHSVESMPLDEEGVPHSSINTIPFSRIGGTDIYLSKIGIQGSSAVTQVSNDCGVVNTLKHFQDAIPVIHELETRALMFREQYEELWHNGSGNQMYLIYKFAL